MTKFLQSLVFIIALFIQQHQLFGQLRVNAMPSWENDQEESIGWTGHSMIVWGTAFGGKQPYTAVLKVDDTIRPINDPYPVTNASCYIYNHYWGSVYMPYKCGFHWVKIEVTDGNGTKKADSAIIFISNAPTDSMKVNMMIDKGYLYLFKHAWNDGNYIYFKSYSNPFSYAATASTLIAFQERGHFETNDSFSDPYAVFIHKGLGFILNKYSGQLKIDSFQTNCYGRFRMDLYTDGKGRDSGAFLCKNGSDDVYTNSFGLLAVIMSRKDSAQANSSIITSGRFRGWSYYNLILNALDLIYWNQNDGGVRCGLWNYNIVAPTSNSGDGSIEQWPVLVFKAAEDRWKIKTPSWVDSTTMAGYRYLTSTTGKFTGGCGYSTNTSWRETAKTAGKLMAYAWAGKFYSNSDPDAVSAVNFIQRFYFNLGLNYSDTSGWASNLYNSYSLKKGMRFQKIDSLYVKSSWRNWYYDMIAWFSGNTIYPMNLSLFNFSGYNNTGNCFGQFPKGAWVESRGNVLQGDTSLCTAHVLLLLLPHLFEPHTVVIIHNDTICPGKSITLTASEGKCYNWFPPAGLSNTSIRNPIATPNNSITYMVNIGDSTNCPCPNKFEMFRITLPNPRLKLMINDSFQCLKNNHFDFTNNSTGITTSYFWDLGDHMTSILKNISHQYATYDTFRVKLKIISQYGCKDSLERSVVVAPEPKASFSIPVDKQCLSGNLFSFYDSSKTVWNETHGNSWNFGDHDTILMLNPTHVYLSSDTFIVRLVTTSEYGCNDTTYKNVVVYPMLEAKISVDTVTKCFSANQFIFKNKGNNPPGTFSDFWDFGDSKTSDSIDINHSYSAVDTYHVRLYSASIYGCKDTATISVNVLPMPKPGFVIDSTLNCLARNRLIFTDSGSISAGSYTNHWDFGDSTTMDSINARHRYKRLGVFSVKLISTSKFGCADSVLNQVRVKLSYPPDFSIDSTRRCLTTNLFHFTNTTSNLSGIKSYHWYFGDGDSSVSKDTSHIYLSIGTFSVKLLIVFKSTCADSVIKIVHVYPTPHSDFTIDSLKYCLSSNKIIFTNSGSISSGSFTNHWNLGDSTTTDSFNTNHSYKVPGNFVIRLISTSLFGCIDSASKTVNIGLDYPAGFSIDSSKYCLNDNHFVFTNTSPNLTGISSYLWNFGDGDSLLTKDAIHSYSGTGSFPVKLKIIFKSGCSESEVKNINVYPSVHPDFTIDSLKYCLSDNKIFSTNTGSISSGTFTNHWNFGDSSTMDSFSSSHTYKYPGNFIVRLISTSLFGCIDSALKTVRIGLDYPADFSIDSSKYCLNVNRFVFTNTSPNLTGISSYHWDFGDGASLLTKDAAHSYSNPGTYPVKLTLLFSSGCSESNVKTVHVYPTMHSGFTIDSVKYCLKDNQIIFTNTGIISSGSFTNYWDFGDGTHSFAKDTNHIYPATGSYTVKLYSVSVPGCSDSTFSTVHIYPDPVAGFTIDSTNNCFSVNNIILTDQGSIPSGTYLNIWSLGDGNIRTTLNATYSYSSYGTFLVKLESVSLKGCRDSSSKWVTIHPNPFDGFVIDSTFYCLQGNHLIFKNTTTIPLGIFKNRWDFGDGKSDTSLNEIHSYLSTGTYFAKLLSTSFFGCSDSAYAIVHVYPDPDPGFSISDHLRSRCVEQSFHFVPTVETYFQYLWDFGDGNTSSSVAPFHSYTDSGIYNVSLKVVTTAGCTENDALKVTVYPWSVADFDYDLDCCNGLIKFINHSRYATGYNWYVGDKMFNVSVNPQYTFKNSGTYTIGLYTNKDIHCSDTVSKTFDVYLMSDHFFIADAFSPNRDLINDTFYMKGVDYNCCKYRLEIFDRWGEKLYDSDNHKGQVPSWDGTYKGKYVAPGIYYYHILYEDGGKYGMITLLH